MKIRTRPYLILFISLLIVCLFYLLYMVFLNFRLNDWYNRYIDRGQSGLRIFYYSDDSFTNFETSGLTKRVSYSDSTDNQFKRKGFSLRVAGIFTPPVSGHYKFFLKSDDGSSLYIDNEMVIDNGGIHPACEIPKTVFLKKGPHLIVIEYFQALGKAELDFSWLKTKKTERGNDLELFFSPVISSFVWDSNITQFKKIARWKKGISIILLFVNCAVFMLCIFFKFERRICNISSIVWIRYRDIFNRHKLLGISILLIIVLFINFYPIFLKGKTFVSKAGMSHVQDPGGPFWEIEPYSYLHNYYYFEERVLPLWNPYEGTGFPLAAVMNCGTFSPFGFLQSLYPSQLTMDFFMFFRLFIAGFFMYLFLKIIKIHPFASFIGAYYFMLSPPHIACINQFQMDTVVFIPVVLYFLEKALIFFKKRDWVLVSIFITLATLGGNPEECILLISLVSLYFFFRLFLISGFSKIIKYLRNYFIMVILGLCLAAFFLLPAIEFYKNSLVTNRTYGSGLIFSLYNLFRLLLLTKIPQLPTPTLFVNIITFILVLITILNFKNLNKYSKVYAIISYIYIFFFLSMVFNNPYLYWIKKLPIILHIWWDKYTSTFYFVLTILVSIGLNALIESRKFIQRKNLIFIGSFLAALMVFIVKYYPFKEGYEENSILFCYLSIISVFLILTIYKILMPGRGIRYAVLISLLILIDIFLFIPRTYPDREKRLAYPDAVVYLKKLYKRTPFRVHPIGAGNVLEPNRNCIYQLPIIDHSGILQPKRYSEFYRFVEIRKESFKHLRKYLDFLAVRYIYSANGPIFEKDLREIYNKEKHYIYENEMAYPRAFIVHHALKLSKRDEILGLMSNPNFDLRYSVILEKELPEEILNCHEAPLKDNSYAQFIGYTPNRILIKAVMENDGFLVLSDTYYPGWKVYVDGQEKEILLADYLVRAVYLDKGTHNVEFVYSPSSFKLGCIISIIALILLSIFLII